VKRNVIAEADQIINSDRPSKYGTVTDSFSRIAAAFNAMRPHGGPFTAEDVARLLVCMKLVRDGYSPSNPDHVTDAIGYLGLLDQLRQAATSSTGEESKS
jgi:hypothetical protein